jgi:hypothetical protein
MGDKEKIKTAEAVNERLSADLKLKQEEIDQ